MLRQRAGYKAPLCSSQTIHLSPAFARIARVSISIAPRKKPSRCSAPSRNGRSGFHFCAARAAPSGEAQLSVGSEVVIRSWLPGDEEQLYEVDALISNFRLSLVGAYSLRRRLDFRIERRTSCSQAARAAGLPGLSRQAGRPTRSLATRAPGGRRISRLAGPFQRAGRVQPGQRGPRRLLGTHPVVALIDPEC